MVFVKYVGNEGLSLVLAESIMQNKQSNRRNIKEKIAYIVCSLMISELITKKILQGSRDQKWRIVKTTIY